MFRIPYKLGEVVVGDEPLTGRHEGIIVAIRGTDLALRCTSGGKTHDVYYDYRNVLRAG